MNKKILFCQFHNELINKSYEKDIADRYYNGIYQYKENDGYFKTNEFFELPLWIAEICGSLKHTAIKKDILIIEDTKKALKDINKAQADYILFSALDVNKGYIKEIISNYKGSARFILGGYIDFKNFEGFKNVTIFKTVKAFISFLGLKYSYNLDYTLFNGFKTVPRLTLSTGCLNKCKFCIVDRLIIEKSKRDIIKQIEAFKPLKFKLVYLNDKTLGQAENYKLLPLIYKRIKKYNPAFKGFIIQTTCNQFLKKDFVQAIKGAHIFACEIGIESYNNDILAGLKKPQNTKTIDKAIDKLKELNIKIIPNLIIGLIGENKASYNQTLNFIKRHKRDIYLLNIYNLAVYLNSELSKEIEVNTDNDLNENCTNKSFYNKEALKNNEYFYNSIFKLGMKLLKRIF